MSFWEKEALIATNSSFCFRPTHIYSDSKTFRSVVSSAKDDWLSSNSAV